MALINKKLSSYNNLQSTAIDSTTKLVAISGSVIENKNIPLDEFVEDSLVSTSSIKPLSAKQGKVLKSLIDNIEVSPSNNVFKNGTYTIDTGDFFPPATSKFPFLMTPGSYGVVFTDPPIPGLNETNFNLKVDYVSFDASGEDGDQDILQTLTTKDGVSYTRRLYHVYHQGDMSATDFKTLGDTNEYFSYSTFTKYTIINGTLIEI